MKQRDRRVRPQQGRGAWFLLLALLALVGGGRAAAAPVATTVNDFRMPGTQPLTVSDSFSTPDDCAACHADYGQPNVEPLRSWAGSMMAQSGRDPLTYAAMAIVNQDASNAGEMCIRCHLPKGWLEGRSAAADGSMLTADDRQGVQCTICHRMVDPFPAAENPSADSAILAALTDPVTVLASAQMVVDPLERLRGPFDIVADLGSDPHLPGRSTLQSAFHHSSELCGVCHNLRIPVYTRNAAGEFEPGPLDTPGDPALGFPEQSTYDEWLNSEYAATGVYAPQFVGDDGVVSSCQDCHMPHVAGRDAEFGLDRDDVPLHSFLGANTFIPDVLEFHPVFGAEVDAGLLQETVGMATNFLRKAATVSASLDAGNLTVRVTNESGHKLPTGYPDGRRMWLHVRALDAGRNVVFESGRYIFSSADLLGYEALPTDPDYDPSLQVWETHHGISPDWALALGRTAGPSFHLALNNVREFDNRIPPRGFTNAAYATVDAQPVGQAYGDGEYWDDVVYPVGATAVQAEVVLYYQTASKEYVEFLRDENTTTASGNILFDLWDQHNKSVPVEMARVFVEGDARVVARCHKTVSRALAKYWKTYAREWARCYASEAEGLTCDAAGRDSRLAAAALRLRAKVGGSKDKRCVGAALTPATLGHGSVCPVPCSETTVFDMDELAVCGVCVAAALAGDALEAAYGVDPPALPAAVPAGAPLKCQDMLAKAAVALAGSWTAALARCEAAKKSGRNDPALDCASDPDLRIARALEKADRRIDKCKDLSGLGGCAGGGTVADTQSCVAAAIGAVAPSLVQVGYP